MQNNEPPVILIVDDNEELRALLTQLLRGRQYIVIEAQNGQEGVIMAELTHPDLILMDLQMPVMDGLNAAQHIRQQDQLREIPIIFFTAYGREGMDLYLHIETLGKAPIEYLTKPLDLEQVKSTIESLLNQD